MMYPMIDLGKPFRFQELKKNCPNKAVFISK
jgi:hypothetical protein